MMQREKIEINIRGGQWEPVDGRMGNVNVSTSKHWNKKRKKMYKSVMPSMIIKKNEDKLEKR